MEKASIVSKEMCLLCSVIEKNGYFLNTDHSSMGLDLPIDGRSIETEVKPIPTVTWAQ